MEKCAGFIVVSLVRLVNSRAAENRETIPVFLNHYRLKPIGFSRTESPVAAAAARENVDMDAVVDVDVVE
jgi:hypothetical protein